LTEIIVMPPMVTDLKPQIRQPVKLITSFAHCKATDVDRAVAAGRRVFNEGTWSRSAPEYRKEVLLKLAALVEQNKEELAVLESIDAGKTITDCLHEVGTEAPAFFRWYAELADKTFGKIAPTGDDAMALIVKEPAGVAGRHPTVELPVLDGGVENCPGTCGWLFDCCETC
jgi:aldehyde dehydrogenase (NAD+)/gamma-glutamyl-gamma-aminobutyraldehyde dehydrogenase